MRKLILLPLSVFLVLSGSFLYGYTEVDNFAYNWTLRAQNGEPPSGYDFHTSLYVKRWSMAKRGWRNVVDDASMICPEHAVRNGEAVLTGSDESGCNTYTKNERGVSVAGCSTTSISDNNGVLKVLKLSMKCVCENGYTMNNNRCEPIAPTQIWTSYCTGGSDPYGNNYQVWQYDNSNPRQYRNTGSRCFPPTVDLKANGQDSLTVKSGDAVTYTWSISNASSAWSYQTATGCFDPTRNSEGNWLITSPGNGQYNPITILSQWLGCRWNIIVTAQDIWGQRATDTMVVSYPSISSCTNGANNPPTCNTCTAPKVWSSITNTCENPCTNGATNPPTCTNFVCQGAVPADSVVCPNDTTDVPQNTTNTVVSACTSTRKCEYTCKAGYGVNASGTCAPTSLPAIESPTATDITSTSARLGARVTSVGVPAPLSRRGVCWGTNNNPAVRGDGTPATGTLGCQAEGGTGIGIFTVLVSGLSPNTNYFYRGYATNLTGTVYTGSTFIFKTNPGPSGTISATACTIPLGQSTCNTSLTWTTQNLIANRPTAVTTPVNITVSTSTTGTNVTRSVTHGNTNFFLYHNAQLLASVTAIATCATGSVWDTQTRKCIAESCTNGATNPPICDECTAPQVWNPRTLSCTDPKCPLGTTYVYTATRPNKCCTAAEVQNNTGGCGTSLVCLAGTQYVSTSTKPALNGNLAKCCSNTEIANNTYNCGTTPPPACLAGTQYVSTSTKPALNGNLAKCCSNTEIANNTYNCGTTPPPACLAGTIYTPGSTKPALNGNFAKCCSSTEIANNTYNCGVCNNDGVCAESEGCICSDCLEKQDHCSDGGVCKKDPAQPSCTMGACCLINQVWSCTTNTCENPCTNGATNPPTCTNFVCQGAVPADSVVCPNDTTDVPQNTTNTVVSACTSTRKCEYTCKAGYGVNASGTCAPTSLPAIESPTATDITSTSARLGARVTSVGVPAPLSRRGVCWGTNNNPAVRGDGTPATGTLGCQAEGGTGIGIFTVLVSGLSPNTNYFYRGYATNLTGTVYTGSTFIFKTNPGPSGTISATACTIPLGQSTCNTSLTWTTQNLIANRPTAVTTPVNITVSTSTTGTNVTRSVTHGNTNFFLYHNAQLLASVTAIATCATGSVWDTQTRKCIAESCTNGATNPPACTQCPANTTLVNGVCTCTNGATNPPTCNTCAAPQVWNPTMNRCDNACPAGETYVPDSAEPDRCCTSDQIATNQNQCGTATPPDRCLNIAGVQNTVPPQYIRDEATGNCCESGSSWNSSSQSCQPVECPICVDDGVCSPTETCECRDCDGEQNNCQDGLVCRYNQSNPLQSSCQPNCTLPEVWDGTRCVAPVSGQCGTANGRTFAEDDTGYGAYTQCDRGIPSLSFFPRPGDTNRWVCRGAHGGTDSPECSATRQGPGACGTAARTYAWNVSNFGTYTFCQEGNPIGSVPSFPARGSTVSWRCEVAGSSVEQVSCFANRGIRPLCGTNQGTYAVGVTSFPVNGVYCSSGTPRSTPSFPSIGQTVTWECSTGNGPNASCSAIRNNNDPRCPADTTYVSTSTKPGKCCTPDEVTNNTYSCGTDGGCNYDNICDADEGCLCPDCNGEQDHCEDGLICSDEICEPPVQCPQTQVPTSIAPGSIPYIACTEGRGTHFMYTIRGPGGYVFSSPKYLHSVGAVRHSESLDDLGTYTVQCYYGNLDTLTLSECESTITVTTGIGGQSCQSLTVYKLGLPVTLSSDAFTGSVVCHSTQPVNGPGFSMKFGTAAWIDNISNDTSYWLSIVRPYISLPQTYQFNTGSTPVECRVKSGNGYVTSDACKTAVSVCPPGENCVDGPKTFVVTPSQNTLCTTSNSLTYNISCGTEGNPDTCRSVLENLQYNNGRATTSLIVQISGRTESRELVCTKSRPDGAVRDVIDCQMVLPTGTPVSLWTGDFGVTSYQSISHIATTDNTPPTASITRGSSTIWSKSPVSVEIVCTNDDPANNDPCTCGDVMDVARNSPVPQWATTSLTDTTTYTRTFNEGRYNNQRFYVTDKAGNRSSTLTVDLGIDTTPPTISVTPNGNTITITARDTLSGLAGGITYRTTNDVNCYASSKSFGTGNTAPQSIGINFTPGSTTIYYCASDAAGNVTYGQYPQSTTTYYGCFADGIMSPIPNLTTYTGSLIARIVNNKFGYSLSDTELRAQNQAFQTRLAQNIATYITSQYASTNIPLAGLITTNLRSEDAAIIGLGGIPNPNGYFYYKSINDGTVQLSDTQNSSIAITSPKVLYVENANVYIQEDIVTSGNGSLVIIVNGVKNIYIHPDVKRIDATLIISNDGALVNRATIDGPDLDWITPTERDSLDNQKLVINGRIFTYNNRGESLTVVGGNTLTPNSTVDVKTAARDLERFRLTTTPPTSADQQCTLYVTGYVPPEVPVLSGVIQ